MKNSSNAALHVERFRELYYFYAVLKTASVDNVKSFPLVINYANTKAYFNGIERSREFEWTRIIQIWTQAVVEVPKLLKDYISTVSSRRSAYLNSIENTRKCKWSRLIKVWTKALTKVMKLFDYLFTTLSSCKGWQETLNVQSYLSPQNIFCSDGLKAKSIAVQ